MSETEQKLLAALKKSEQRIHQLCALVNALDRNSGGNGRKVRAEDFADVVVAAIAKTEGR